MKPEEKAIREEFKDFIGVIDYNGSGADFIKEKRAITVSIDDIMLVQRNRINKALKAQAKEIFKDIEKSEEIMSPKDEPIIKKKVLLHGDIIFLKNKYLKED